MSTRTVSLAISLLLAVTAAGELAAQRRTTGGSSTPSGGRSTPSAGGSTSTPSGGRRSAGGSTSQPGRSSGGTAQGGSGSSGSSRPTARGGSGGSGSSGEDGGAGAGEQDDRPTAGKIGAIGRRAASDRTRVVRGVVVGRPVYIGRCWDCDYFGWYGPRWGWYHGGYWYPAERRRRPDAREDRDESGQAYLDYPYAEPGGSGDTFMRSSYGERRGFGTLTLGYFSDVGSTTQGGHLAVEGVVRGLRGELEYRQYAEPVVGRTDHLHTVRATLAVQPRLGRRAFLTAGGGVRGVFLGDGTSTAGPEGSLGLQVFPARPLGANVTGRVAALSWNGEHYFALREVNTTGSVFLGRVEVQAGWHWMKMGSSPAFGGPVLATRIWF